MKISYSCNQKAYFTLLDKINGWRLYFSNKTRFFPCFQFDGEIALGSTQWSWLSHETADNRYNNITIYLI